MVMIGTWVLPLMGLSSGPTTPEAVGFSKLEPGEDVNLYTGDFSYTVPLFSMGGYPFNLTYSSNVTMEQEASWVGLGWNLDIGAIDRQVRGLPDDFRGDKVVQEDNIRPDITATFGVGLALELIGREQESGKIRLLGKKKGEQKKEGAILTLGFNNYRGLIWGVGFKGVPASPAPTKNTSFGLQMNMGVSLGSSGLNLSPHLGLEAHYEKERVKYSGDVGFGFNINSRMGVQSLDFNYGYRSQLISEKEHPSLGQTQAISYQLFSFTPVSDLKFRNIGGHLNIKFLGEIFWSGFGKSLKGSFSMQELAEKRSESAAYGYFYLPNRRMGGDELADVAREKDLTFMPGIPSLPQPHVQPDMFSVHAGGLSGTYRAFKNMAQVMGDHQMTAGKGRDINISLEIGSGGIFKLGTDVTYMPSESKKDFYVVPGRLPNSWQSSGANWDNSFEVVYFRRIDGDGEGLSKTYLDSIGRDKAVNLMPQLFTPKYSAPPLQSTSFIPITYAMIQKHPLYSRLYQRYYSSSASSYKPHHVTHIEITAEGGARYVFGCPAYNHVEKEVVFNVSQSGPGIQGDSFNDYIKPYVKYNQADATTGNRNGKDHYFHSQTLPPYAYAYHLTEVYSPNYADLTGDGPTPDDPGDYLLFSYSKKVSRYKWRSPMTSGPDSAKFNPGYLSRADDNKAYYTYGEKDIWYVDSVRSKHEIAIFYTSEREDGKEAAREHGGIGRNSLFKLDSIYVYDLADYRRHGLVAQPKKRIRLYYDYSLCPGVPNNSSRRGKLTLVRLEIIEGHSYRPKRSHYRFMYGENPPYDPDRVDRWGGYKPVNEPLKGLYPYSVQDSVLANQAARAWRLSAIDLPGGGRIEIDYEADRYAYVQDKKATRMFKLVSVSDSSNNTSSTGVQSLGHNKWLIFETDIPATLGSSTIDAEFQKYFPAEVESHLYFKALVRVTPKNPLHGLAYPNLYEYVSGFGVVDQKRCFIKNNKVYGAIRLKPAEPKNGLRLHPFEMAAMQLVLTEFPEYYQGRQPYRNPDTPEEFAKYVANELARIPQQIFNMIAAMIRGPFSYMQGAGIGSEVIVEKSWIRLAVRDCKYATTSRVREIRYKNNWQAQTAESGADHSYIKRYEYVTPEGQCSGVAAYEPIVGADENPLRVAQTYTNLGGPGLMDQILRSLSPKLEYLYYYPHNEFEYPAAVIGYSRVVVKNILPESNKTTGWTVHEFYTDRDYPVKTSATTLPSSPILRKVISMFFFRIENVRATVEQGFCTILSNMPGQRKAAYTFDGDSNCIRKHIYRYQLPNLAPRSSGVNGLYPNDSVRSVPIRVESEVVVDLRKQVSKHQTFNLQLNLDVSPAPPLFIPIPLPPVWTGYGEQLTEYYSVVVNKTLYTYATLMSEEIEERGARLDIEYLAFDPITYRPLVQSVRNKFGTYTYGYELPAYYVYPQLGPVSAAEGRLLSIQTDNNGRIPSNPLLYSLLADGTQLLVPDSSAFYWVYEVNLPPGNRQLYLINRAGQLIANLPSQRALIWRSGARNRLFEAVENIQTKRNPITLSSSIHIDSSHQVLSASATTYVDYTSLRVDTCGCVNGGCATSGKETDGTPTLLVIRTGTDYLYSCRGGLVPLPSMPGQESVAPLTSSMPDQELVSLNVSIQEGCGSCTGRVTVTDIGRVSEIYLDTLLLRGEEEGRRPCPDSRGVNYSLTLDNLCPGVYPIAICRPNRLPARIFVWVGSGQLVGVFSRVGTSNPYLLQLRNAWRPYQAYIYLTDRTPTPSDAPALPEQSHYLSFRRFWTYHPQRGWRSRPLSPWKLVHTTTYADYQGNPIEQQDVLGNFSTAWYNYYGSLQEGIAYNARNEEVAFDGFEYYHAVDTVSSFSLRLTARELLNAQGRTALVRPGISHTGLYAARLGPRDQLTYTTCIHPLSFKREPITPFSPPPYSPSPALLSGRWAPFDTLRPYLISVWVRTPDPTQSLPSEFLTVTVNNQPVPVTKIYESPPIEGWRLFRYRVHWSSTNTPPPAFSPLSIVFRNPLRQPRSPAVFPAIIFIDDVRIEPEDAESRVFVYHPFRKQLLGVLDENHFATKYFYNAQDELEKVAKETEGGDVFILYKKGQKSEKNQ